MSNEICLVVDILLLIPLIFCEVVTLHWGVISLIGGVVADLCVAHAKVSLGQLLLHGLCSIRVWSVHSTEVLMVVCGRALPQSLVCASIMAN